MSVAPIMPLHATGGGNVVQFSDYLTSAPMQPTFAQTRSGLLTPVGFAASPAVSEGALALQAYETMPVVAADVAPAVVQFSDYLTPAPAQAAYAQTRSGLYAPAVSFVPAQPSATDYELQRVDAVLDYPIEHSGQSIYAPPVALGPLTAGIGQPAIFDPTRDIAFSITVIDPASISGFPIPSSLGQPVVFDPAQAVELDAFEAAAPEIEVVQVERVSVPETEAATIAAPWIDMPVIETATSPRARTQEGVHTQTQVQSQEGIQTQSQTRSEARPQTRPEARARSKERLFERRRRGSRSRRRRSEIDLLNDDIDRERRNGRFPAIAQWVDSGSVRRMDLHSGEVYDWGTSETTASPHESFRVVEYARQRPPRRFIDLPGRDDIIIDAGGATGITGRETVGVQRRRKVVR